MWKGHEQSKSWVLRGISPTKSKFGRDLIPHTWHEGPLLCKALHSRPVASGGETDLRFYSDLCRASNRVRQQTTRLPCEAAPAMVVLMAYAVEERQLWVTNPSRRNNATRNRRTRPRPE